MHRYIQSAELAENFFLTDCYPWGPYMAYIVGNDHHDDNNESSLRESVQLEHVHVPRLSLALDLHTTQLN